MVVFVHTLCATTTCVRRTLELLVGALTGAGLSRCDTERVELILAEALNNIVEHAYGGQDGGNICVRIIRDADRLCLHLCDQGRPWPGGALYQPCAATLDVPRADLPEGGFGWFLIHSLAHRLDHHRSGHDNHLEIELHLDPPG